MAMKVYYIGNRYDGCYYVRCYLPLLHNGWDGTKTAMWKPIPSPEQMAKGALSADVIVFQRPDDQQRLDMMRLLKQAGKKIVFDNDDTYKPNSGVPTIMTKMEHQIKLDERNKILDTFIKEADLVTTTTEFLADEYRQLNDNVVVLPNMVDPDDWEKPKRNRGKKVRIGLVGSVVSSDFRPIKDTIKKLAERDDVTIVVLGLFTRESVRENAEKLFKEEYEFWNSIADNIEWHEYVAQDEYNDKLNDLKLDMMLIPRDDSYFNRCKSNIKFLEASMLEIPVIAQGFKDGKSPYQDPEDAKHMIVVMDEWESEIEALVSDKKKRREIGKNARKYVLKRYNIQNNAHLWKETYTKNVI